MLNVKYTISHSILLNIVKAELEKVNIESVDAPRATEEIIINETRTLDIFHLAHMLGLDMTLRTARRVVEGKTILEEGLSNKLLNNFRNTLEYIRSLSNSYSDLDAGSFLHLNKIILNGWRDSWDVKYRTGGEELDLRVDPWAEIRKQDIDAVDIQSFIYSAVGEYNSTHSKIHPLVRIGVMLYHLVRISPFIIGNRLTTLAIAEMLFYQTGYSAKEYMPLVKTFDIFEEEYVESWAIATQSEEDITLWLERFIKNIANEMVNTRDRFNKLLEEERKKNKQPFLDLNKRQLKILRYLQTIPSVKREDYVRMLNVSTMTAFRDLSELVDKRLLRVEGKGRGTRYTLVTR
jgi:Fic family protein